MVELASKNVLSPIRTLVMFPSEIKIHTILEATFQLFRFRNAANICIKKITKTITRHRTKIVIVAVLTVFAESELYESGEEF